MKLLRFAISINTVPLRNEAEKTLHTAMLPLLQLPDEHVLATISAVVLALSIGGVFGAGKIRSAAVLFGRAAGV